MIFRQSTIYEFEVVPPVFCIEARKNELDRVPLYSKHPTVKYIYPSPPASQLKYPTSGLKIAIFRNISSFMNAEILLFYIFLMMRS